MSCASNTVDILPYCADPPQRLRRLAPYFDISLFSSIFFTLIIRRTIDIISLASMLALSDLWQSQPLITLAEGDISLG